jgi:hypothetical protein
LGVKYRKFPVFFPVSREFARRRVSARLPAPPVPLAAAAEFQKILDHSGIIVNCWTGALTHLGVARADVLQSRTSQGADADAARVRALAAYKDFLTLWKDADPDISILKQAKTEYAKLQQLERVLSSVFLSVQKPPADQDAPQS